MELITLIFIITIIYLLYIFFNQYQNAKIDDLIPVVSEGCLPILGHVFSFYSNKSKFLLSDKEHYDTCFIIKLFLKPVIFILDPGNWPTILRHFSIQVAFDEISS